MNLSAVALPEWPIALRRYLAISFVFHLAWEVLQLPLYTIWSDSISRQAFAVFHCTVGDLMIAGLSLLVALAVFGKTDWPLGGSRAVWVAVVVLGAGYTVYSEWLNVNVRGSWAYSPLMPTLPILGTGLSPLMQWLLLPTVVLRAAIGRWPWNSSQ